MTQKHFALFLLCSLSNWALLNAETESGESILTVLILSLGVFLAWLLPLFPLPRKLTSLIAFAGFFIFILEGISKTELKVLALTHFLMFIQILFFLIPIRLKEEYLLIIISFIEFLVASMLTESMLFIAFLSVYILIGIPTLLKLNWRSTTRDTETLPTKLMVHSTVLIAIPLFPLVVMLFLIIPRFNLGMFGYLDFYDYSRTGFTNAIQLGSMRRVLEDDTTVFTIQGTPMDIPYLRGKAFDEYYRSTWISQKNILHHLPSRGNYLFVAREAFEAEPLTNLQQHLIRIFSFKHTILPVPPNTALIGYPAAHISQDTNDSIYMPTYPKDGTVYETYSISESQFREPLASITSYQGELVPVYTSIDPTLRRRFKPLALKITNDVSSPLAKVERIQNYLLREYTYSLNHKVKRGIDPVEHFLFYQKEGHCEYFASALALLLRSIDIPSRFVNGFIVREVTPEGAVVRQKDSHAWVEVYFHGAGWFPFDATPATLPTSGNRLTSWLLAIKNRLETRFRLLIIEYSQLQQRAFVEKAVSSLKSSAQTMKLFLKSTVSQTLHQVQSWREHKIFYFYLIFCLPIIFLFVIILWFSLFRNMLMVSRRERRTYSKEVREARKSYMRVLKRLAQAGIEVKPSETCEDVMLRLAENKPGLETDNLFSTYQAVRFGEQTTTRGYFDLLFEEFNNSLRRSQ